MKTEINIVAVYEIGDMSHATSRTLRPQDICDGLDHVNLINLAQYLLYVVGSEDRRYISLLPRDAQWCATRNTAEALAKKYNEYFKANKCLYVGKPIPNKMMDSIIQDELVRRVRVLPISLKPGV